MSWLAATWGWVMGSGWIGAIAAIWAALLLATAAAYVVFARRRAARPANGGESASADSFERFSQRMPLLDLVKRAASKGWDTSGRNLQIMDLLYGLRHASLQGEIRMWGRPHHKPDAAVMTELHRPIPIPHWRHYEFDVGTIAGRADNFETRTCNLRQDDAHLGGFVDIYVDRQAALDWLENAERFKGAYKPN